MGLKKGETYEIHYLKQEKIPEIKHFAMAFIKLKHQHIANAPCYSAKMIRGLRLPHLVRKLSEMYPVIGSEIASTILGIAPANPTSAGFTPNPRFKTITICPIKADCAVFANAPTLYMISETVKCGLSVQ